MCTCSISKGRNQGFRCARHSSLGKNAFALASVNTFNMNIINYMKQKMFFTAKVLNWDKSLIHNLIPAPQLCRKFYVRDKRFHFCILRVWKRGEPNLTQFQINLHTKCGELSVLLQSDRTIGGWREGTPDWLTGKIINKIHKKQQQQKQLTNLPRLLSMMIFLYKHVTKAKWYKDIHLR